MLQRNKTISPWQISMIIFVLMLSNKVLIFPSILVNKSQFDCFLIVTLLFGFEMLLLGLFLYAKKKFGMQRSFFETLKINFGSVFLWIFSIFCVIFFFSKTVLLFNVFQVFMRNVMYKNADIMVFLSCALPVANFLAISGTRTLGRTIQLFFPLVFVVIFFCVVVGMFQVEFNIPVSFFSSNKILLTTFRYLSVVGDTLFLFVVLDKVSIKRGDNKKLFIFSILGMLFVYAVFFAYVFSYFYTSFLHPFAIFELLSFVKEYSGLGRIDIIVVILMMILFYFHFSIYLKALLDSVSSVVKTSEKYIVIFYDIVFSLVVSLFIFNIERAFIFAEIVLPVVLCFLIFLITVAVFCAKKGEK